MYYVVYTVQCITAYCVLCSVYCIMYNVNHVPYVAYHTSYNIYCIMHSVYMWSQSWSQPCSRSQPQSWSQSWSRSQSQSYDEYHDHDQYHHIIMNHTILHHIHCYIYAVFCHTMLCTEDRVVSGGVRSQALMTRSLPHNVFLSRIGYGDMLSADERHV